MSSAGQLASLFRKQIHFKPPSNLLWGFSAPLRLLPHPSHEASAKHITRIGFAEVDWWAVGTAKIRMLK